MSQMQQIDVMSFMSAFRPENLRKQMKENNGVAIVKLSDHVKSDDKG